MDRKMLTIILALVLIAGFFLPMLSYGGASASAFDMVKGPGGDWKKYIILLVPLSGVLLLIGALNNENYFLGRGLLTILPLLTILFLLFIDPLISGAKFDQILKGLGKGYGIGMWLMIGGSLVLALYQPRRR
jgi:hypothetical protein